MLADVGSDEFSVGDVVSGSFFLKSHDDVDFIYKFVLCYNDDECKILGSTKMTMAGSVWCSQIVKLCSLGSLGKILNLSVRLSSFYQWWCEETLDM